MIRFFQFTLGLCHDVLYSEIAETGDTLYLVGVVVYAVQIGLKRMIS